jgi:NAD-dependent SIR2 family protein deacetylase
VAGLPADRIVECHGTIRYWQCHFKKEGKCKTDVWPRSEWKMDIDPTTDCALDSQLPMCPNCGGLARPNVLMFGDVGWLDKR